MKAKKCIIFIKFLKHNKYPHYQQKFKQSTKEKAKVTNINKYMQMPQNQEFPLEECFTLEVFFVMKH